MPWLGCQRESKTVTPPIGVEDILAMVEAIPDPRWRLAFQRWPRAAKPNPGPFGCCRAIHGQRPGTWFRPLIEPCRHGYERPTAAPAR